MSYPALPFPPTLPSWAPSQQRNTSRVTIFSSPCLFCSHWTPWERSILLQFGLACHYTKGRAEVSMQGPSSWPSTWPMLRSQQTESALVPLASSCAQLKVSITLFTRLWEMRKGREAQTFRCAKRRKRKRRKAGWTISLNSLHPLSHIPVPLLPCWALISE